MPKYWPKSLRFLVAARSLPAFFAIAILCAAAAPAHARKSGGHRHPRLRALAPVFLEAALPNVGFLPDNLGTVPEDGQKYELTLGRKYTGEIVNVVYRIGDTYIPEALDKLNQFLRDSHNQEVSNFDPRTFDLLHTVLAKLGKPGGVVDIVSGYRSQETNDTLVESRTTNAARFSQHIYAKAVDVRVPGVPAPVLRDAALSLGAGGVGYYPKGQFVHIDVGPVRQWTFAPHAAAAHKHSRKHAHTSRRRRA